MTFPYQTAIITGASRGIGHALALELAGRGCKVGLLARQADDLLRLTKEIEDRGGAALFAVADVTQREPTVLALRQLAGRLGPVDLLIANAGVGAPTLVDPFNVSDVEKMMQVNVMGAIYSLEAVLPEMLARGRGHLAAVSSLAAHKGLPGESAYCASKAALSCFLDGLRVQLRGRGIHVTTLSPGFVRTAMTEVNDFHMPWLLEADEAARRMVRALVRRKKVYEFPQPTALLMKLARWAPDWLLERIMGKYNEAPPMPKAPL